MECSGDPEFDNSTFKACLSKHSIDYKPRPTRRHQNTGIVDSCHGSIKLLLRRLSLDVAQNFISYYRKPTFAEIISHATYLQNLLYGSRTISSFEKARGYQPSVLGLPQFSSSTRIYSKLMKNKSHGESSPEFSDTENHLYCLVQFWLGTPVW
jgi:hypothetical protein